MQPPNKTLQPTIGARSGSAIRKLAHAPLAAER